MTVLNIPGKPMTIEFDLLNGNLPLIIGLDVEKIGNTKNMGKRNIFRI